MQYKVNCYFGRGADVACATFKNIADARLFVEKKLALDLQLKLSVTYRIYHFDEMVQEYGPLSDAAGQSQAAAGGAQGKSSTAAFRPTPFNTAPRPSGTPPKWMVDPDDDADKNK